MQTFTPIVSRCRHDKDPALSTQPYSMGQVLIRFTTWGELTSTHVNDLGAFS
jgi:hypothetical protein